SDGCGCACCKQCKKLSPAGLTVVRFWHPVLLDRVPGISDRSRREQAAKVEIGSVQAAPVSRRLALERKDSAAVVH
ncbi:MAG TPA: hypothetical protein VHE30_02565, partial [Polyangiaceae bacterium]|nr:hypothetical protein [Polyangiaceae bacterium]